MNFSHSVTGLRIGRGRHGARVENHKIGTLVIVKRGQSTRQQTAAQGRGVSVGGAASEIFDREGSHCFERDSVRLWNYTSGTTFLKMCSKVED